MYLWLQVTVYDKFLWLLYGPSECRASSSQVLTLTFAGSLASKYSGHSSIVPCPDLHAENVQWLELDFFSLTPFSSGM